VHIYPSTLSGSKLISRAISPVGSGNAAESMTYTNMRSYLTSTYARPLHDGGLFTTSDSYAYNVCSSGTPSTSAPGPVTVDATRLTSEYCAAVQGTPDAGAEVSSTCTMNNNYDCQFAASGGFARNGQSIISKIGVWAGIGYLWTDIDATLTQQGFNNTNRLYAGGVSGSTSSAAAVPGYRDSGSPLTLTSAYFGARGASSDATE
jgi:hypothetical protein